MKEYEVSVKGDVLEVVLYSKPSEDVVNKYVTDFNAAVRKITPSVTNLKLDASALNVTTPDVHQMLTECFRLYNSVGFKSMSFYFGDNAILKMQMRRLAKEAGIANPVIL